MIVPPPQESELRVLHGIYGELTGNRLALTMERLLTWERWYAHIRQALADTGSTATPAQALRAVVAHRRRQYADKRHILVSVLAFTHLAGRPELAEEDFAAWRAWKREGAARGDAARNAALRASGRPDTAAQRGAADTAQSVGAVLDRQRVLDLIADMKRNAE